MQPILAFAALLGNGCVVTWAMLTVSVIAVPFRVTYFLYSLAIQRESDSSKVRGLLRIVQST